jgi:hypothetical protein
MHNASLDKGYLVILQLLRCIGVCLEGNRMIDSGRGGRMVHRMCSTTVARHDQVGARLDLPPAKYHC